MEYICKGMRRYPFRHLANCRDLGGYGIERIEGTEAGSITAWGRILRSDLPIRMEDSEVELLQSWNIRTIIDLRSDEERERTPCFFRDQKRFCYHAIPMAGNGGWPEREEDTPVQYLDMAADVSSMGAIFRAILEADGGVMVHCAAGKDRTGIVSALLLLLCGVYREDILTDYEVSHTYLRERVRQMHRENPNLPPFLGQSRMEYMEAFLLLFLQCFKTPEEYFVHLGFSKQDRTRVREKLMD